MRARGGSRQPSDTEDARAFSASWASPARHHHRHHVSAWGKEWLTTSIPGARFEIAGGRIAQAESSNAEIEALGARLVADHAKSLRSAVVRKEARTDLPVLRQHLKLAKAALAAVGGNG